MSGKDEKNRVQVDVTGFKDRLQAIADAEERSLSYICAKLIKKSLGIDEFGVKNPGQVGYIESLNNIGDIKAGLEILTRKITKENYLSENSLSPLQQALKFLNLEKVAENSRIPLERLREIQQSSCPDCSEISGLIRAGIDPEILKQCQKHNQQKENQNANNRH